MRDRMKLALVGGVVKQGAYFGEDSLNVWEGNPADLPIAVVQEHDDCTAAQEPTNILGTYAILEFQWRED